MTWAAGIIAALLWMATMSTAADAGVDDEPIGWRPFVYFAAAVAMSVVWAVLLAM